MINTLRVRSPHTRVDAVRQREWANLVPHLRIVLVCVHGWDPRLDGNSVNCDSDIGVCANIPYTCIAKLPRNWCIVSRRLETHIFIVLELVWSISVSKVNVRVRIEQNFISDVCVLVDYGWAEETMVWQSIRGDSYVDRTSGGVLNAKGAEVSCEFARRDSGDGARWNASAVNSLVLEHVDVVGVVGGAEVFGGGRGAGCVELRNHLATVLNWCVLALDLATEDGGD